MDILLVKGIEVNVEKEIPDPQEGIKWKAPRSDG